MTQVLLGLIGVGLGILAVYQYHHFTHGINDFLHIERLISRLSHVLKGHAVDTTVLLDKEHGGRRRSLSFNWILKGHKSISSLPPSAPLVRRIHSVNANPPQKPFNDVHHEIRVVHILPGRFDDPIMCTLETIKSPYKAQYEALSYTWGSALDLEIINLDNHTFAIGKNLEAALRYLRHTRRRRTLWVDALCINQMDRNELNIQVQTMGHIFSSATKVLIWLGKPKEERDHWDIEVNSDLLQETFALVTKLREIYDRSYDVDPFVFATSLRKETHELPLVHASSSGQGQVTAMLLNLLARPWFSRVWMVQEANVHQRAAEVVLGSCSCDLLNFTKTAHYLAMMEDFFAETYGHPHPDYLFPALYVHDLRFAVTHPGYLALPPAFQLLVLCSMASACFHCTDSRDRIFGLLGLISQASDKPIFITNYNKSFEEIATDVAISMLEHTKSFALLCAAPDTSGTVPSWVPTWNRPVIYARKETFFDGYFESLTNFPGQEYFYYEVSLERKVLIASGLILGTIHQTIELPTIELPRGDQEWYTRNKKLLDDFENALKSSGYLTECLQPSQEGYSILCHILEGTRFQWTWKADIMRYDDLMQRLPSTFKSSTEDQKASFLDSLGFVINGDTMFYTTNDYMGRTLLGPSGTKPHVGDCVALLPGCPRPVLMRPVGHNYKYLGECYVHGFMLDGEQRGAFEAEYRLKGKLDPVSLE